MTTQLTISHPGKIIGRVLADMGINGRSFAMNIGVTPSTLKRFLVGNNALTPPLAIRIAAALGGTPEYWLGLQSAYDVYLWMDQIDTSAIRVYTEQDKILHGPPRPSGVTDIKTVTL
ncbi:HigA family addiction module antitoxin [Enterobacter ludwigii]|uniref:HigA family addiction module antitoxin n=1 Tax=Enterobacter TaxID=547 RepID=UPI00307602C4